MVAGVWLVGMALAADARHLDLEQLYTDSQFAVGKDEALRQIAATPKDTELYWHAARFLYEIGELEATPAAGKEALYQQMLDLSDKGLALDPKHAHLRFARGIALGRLGTTQGILSSLSWADDIEQDWLAVAESKTTYSSLGREEILPCDGYMALGSFYRMVPDWWIIEMISGTRGDLDKAIAYLEQADACAPGRIETLKELGVARICYGQQRSDPAMQARGLADLQRMVALPPTKPTDHTDLRHGKMLLGAPDKACAYSRDGQAQLDQALLQP